MDKIAQYQELLINYLEAYAATPYANAPEIEKTVIADRTGSQFQLVSMGGDKGSFSFDVLFHFTIRAGKIWIMQNWTEEEVADELAAKGVPAQDLVIGFLPESARAHSGYSIRQLQSRHPATPPTGDAVLAVAHPRRCSWRCLPGV